jgi:serine/threonine protein kinase
MSRQIGDHLPPEQVLPFGLGLLAPEQTAALESHVADCEACCRALLSVPDDALVSQLRDAVSTSGDSLACHATPTATSNGPAPEPTGGPPPLPPELTSHPRYRVEQLLGAGGMGAVYRAYHRVMERPVALKVISPGLLTRPAVVERFTREIKAAARLSHPNIVAALDAEQAGGVHFLVMEYVEGTDLARLVQQRGPLPVALACEYVRQAALGLQHAHERGLVHRDIKPSNLMLTAGGQVKVLDFGLALLASETAAGDLTSTGVVMGTADYIAPEQADDPHRADIRADLYSLGCTLYFLLTGQPPFPEGNFMQKVIAHSQSTPRPLTDFRNDLPPGLEQALGRMMAKGPAQRYQTPGEAARALVPFATAEVVMWPSLRSHTVGCLIMILDLGTIKNGQTVDRTNDDDIVLEKIDQHCNVRLVSTAGKVKINQKIDQHCSVYVQAKVGIEIGQKIDQHCGVTLVSDGPVSIGQKIDGQSNVNIEATGAISIGRKIDGESTVKLVSQTSIFVGQKVDGHSTVSYSAPSVFWGEQGVKGGSTILGISQG